MFTLKHFAALVHWTLKNPNNYDLLFLAHVMLQNKVPTFLSTMHRTLFKASKAATSSVKCSFKNLGGNVETIIHHLSNGHKWIPWIPMISILCLLYYRPILVIRSFRLVSVHFQYPLLHGQHLTMEVNKEIMTHTLEGMRPTMRGVG